jgi:hypothetical protein
VQPFLNSAKKTLTGFSSGDASGILFMLDQLLKNVVTRAEDVANWPNVSILRYISSLMQAHELEPALSFSRIWCFYRVELKLVGAC